jgi:hypothetical protein
VLVYLEPSILSWGQRSSSPSPGENGYSLSCIKTKHLGGLAFEIFLTLCT